MAEAMAALGFRGATAPAAATAGAGGEAIAGGMSPHHSDYDSDVSEGTFALALRRREASDDDEEEEEGEDEEEGEAEAEGAWLDEEDERENEEFMDERFERRRSRSKEDEGEADGELPKDSAGNGEATVEEKKESEPFMVPTTGAFYMHDDRFRDSGGARPRRGMGGRRLWEAKDEKPWVHDMFEELTIGENDEGFRRRGRGQLRGRGRGRSRGRGRGRPASRTEEALGRLQRGPAKGRGTRRESQQNEEPAPVTNKDAQRTSDKEQAHQSVAKKQVGPSNLSSSSPPFYPSGTLNSSLPADPASESMSQESKRIGTSAARKLTATSSVFVPKQSKPPSTDPSNSLFSAPASLPQISTKKSADSHSYVKNRSVSAPTSGKGKAVSQAQSTNRVLQQPSQVQQSQEAQLNLRANSMASINDSGAALANSVRPRNLAGGRGGRGNALGKNSFMYGAGPAGVTSGLVMRDSSFSPPQVLSPLVQYGNQSQSGMVVPSMGMAVPISGQPLYGYGNSDIAWVPILAGGGNGLGTGFMSPYIPVDGSSSGVYYQPSSQPVFHPTGRDLSSTNPSSTLWRPPSEPSDLASDEGQNKSRSSVAKAQSAY